SPFRVASWIGFALGGIALTLTLTGVFGVLSYLITQRRREIGVRMALGASPGTVVSSVLRQSLRYAAIGAAIGAALALATSKAISSAFVMAIDAYDPPSYVGAIVVVMVACIVAAYVPSRRAAAVDP